MLVAHRQPPPHTSIHPIRVGRERLHCGRASLYLSYLPKAQRKYVNFPLGYYNGDEELNIDESEDGGPGPGDDAPERVPDVDSTLAISPLASLKRATDFGKDEDTEPTQGLTDRRPENRVNSSASPEEASSDPQMKQETRPSPLNQHSSLSSNYEETFTEKRRRLQTPAWTSSSVEELLALPGTHDENGSPEHREGQYTVAREDNSLFDASKEYDQVAERIPVSHKEDPIFELPERFSHVAELPSGYEIAGSKKSHIQSFMEVGLRLSERDRSRQSRSVRFAEPGKSTYRLWGDHRPCYRDAETEESFEALKGKACVRCRFQKQKVNLRKRAQHQPSFQS